MSLDLVRFEPGHADAVCAFQTQLWSPDPAWNRAYLEWKFFTHRPARRTPIFLAFAAGELVGMRADLPTAWSISAGEPTPVPCAGDLMIAQAQRGSSLVARLMKFADAGLRDDGYPLVIGLSACDGAFLVTLRHGGRLLQPHRTLWRPPGPAFVAAPAERANRRGSRPFAELAASGWRDGDIGIEVTDEPWPAELEALLARRGRSERVAARRDAAYFHWRYANPFSRYRFLYAHRRGQLAAYAVLQAPLTYSLDCLRLVDWEALDAEAGAAVLAAAVRAAPDKALVLWTSSLDEPELALLASAGFVPAEVRSRSSRYQPGLLAKLLRDDDVGAHAALGRAWELPMIVSDAY